MNIKRESLVIILSISLFANLYAQRRTPVEAQVEEVYDLNDGHGHDDDVLSLQEIDKLIKDTDYDKALAELHKYIEMNPENFDNAQLRINRIMNARSRYSELAFELVKMIVDDPGNSEGIYKITSELEELEKHPTDKQLAFIRETKIAAEFNYFRNEFERIQKETEDLINQGNYVAAANKSREGFYLYQERFYETWNQSEIITPVNKALSNIDVTLVEFNDIQKRLNDCVNDFIRAVETERQDDIRKTYQTVETVFKDFAVIRNKIYESGNTFKTTFDMTVEQYGAEDTDASFLPFVQRFTLGLAENEKTGIAGALDTQWNEMCDRMKNTVSAKLDRYVSMVEETVPSLLFPETGSSSSIRTNLFPNVKQFSDLAVSVNSLYANLSPSLREESVHYYEVASKFSYDILVQLNLIYSEKDSFLKNIGTIAALEKPENPPEAEMKNSEYIVSVLNTIKEISSDNGSLKYESLLSADWSREYTRIDDTEKRANLQNIYSAYLEEMKGKSSLALNNGYKIVCDYAASCDDEYVKISLADYDEAEKNLNGIQNLILEHYPDKAYTMSNELVKQIDSQVAVIDRHISLIRRDISQVLSSDTISTLNQDRTTLLNLKNRSSELALTANAQLQRAEIARNEADLRYNQAQTALNSNNFENARKRLQDARTKYNESLEYAFSASLQSSSDSKLQALGERINQYENEYVVRDVRDLKTRAKNEYYSGNFEEAETLLNQAKARWAVTNVEEDAEITNLLAVVNTALSMKVGRVLLPSAALYPEMSQILSIAAQYYTEGSMLLERGQREDGVAVLNEALKKLKELQLVYPLNQEASLLTLRIQKVLSPQEFDLMFERKVAEAKVNYKVQESQQQAYTDLLDLYEINPSYPGLKNLIYNVELEIGIRQRPVDNSAAVKSVALTKEAQTLVNNAGRDEAKLRQALSKVDEAISLNGNNNDAIRLKDQIQTQIGGKAAVVLSSEDEIKYQQAIQELQKNNLITANALVEQLLQKQANRNSSKILELQKKIKALL